MEYRRKLKFRGNVSGSNVIFRSQGYSLRGYTKLKHKRLLTEEWKATGSSK